MRYSEHSEFTEAGFRFLIHSLKSEGYAFASLGDAPALSREP